MRTHLPYCLLNTLSTATGFLIGPPLTFLSAPATQLFYCPLRRWFGAPKPTFELNHKHVSAARPTPGHPWPAPTKKLKTNGRGTPQPASSGTCAKNGCAALRLEPLLPLFTRTVGPIASSALPGQGEAGSEKEMLACPSWPLPPRRHSRQPIEGCCYRYLYAQGSGKAGATVLQSRSDCPHID